MPLNRQLDDCKLPPYFWRWRQQRKDCSPTAARIPAPPHRGEKFYGRRSTAGARRPPAEFSFVNTKFAAGNRPLGPSSPFRRATQAGGPELHVQTGVKTSTGYFSNGTATRDPAASRPFCGFLPKNKAVVLG